MEKISYKTFASIAISKIYSTVVNVTNILRGCSIIMLRFVHDDKEISKIYECNSRPIILLKKMM